MDRLDIYDNELNYLWTEHTYPTRTDIRVGELQDKGFTIELNSKEIYLGIE